jgi:retron-type reverse transcriptase
MAHPASERRRGRRRDPFLHDLYPRLTSFPNLLAAAKDAQRGKRFRHDVLAFNSRLEAELFQLQNELRSFTYQPGPYRRFAIRDPKPRLISSAPYRDRVVHHALCAVIAPPLERRFLRSTYANRTGYGSHRALRRFIQASQSHRWVLTADIRLYRCRAGMPTSPMATPCACGAACSPGCPSLLSFPEPGTGCLISATPCS